MCHFINLTRCVRLLIVKKYAALTMHNQRYAATKHVCAALTWRQLIAPPPQLYSMSNVIKCVKLFCWSSICVGNCFMHVIITFAVNLKSSAHIAEAFEFCKLAALGTDRAFCKLRWMVGKTYSAIHSFFCLENVLTLSKRGR